MNISLSDVLPILKKRALELRIDSMRAITAAGSGHVTSCFSAADLVTVLFFHVMNYDPLDHENLCHDRFILSKGHAIPVIYAAFKQMNIISDEELLTLRQFHSRLEGHPTPRFEYNEAATGSLGQGLSVGLGMALYAKRMNLEYKTYVLLGDAEVAEGSVWEAAELASHYNVDNLIACIDSNRLGQSGESIDSHKIEYMAGKWRAFGWKTFVVDGHDIASLLETFQEVKKVKDQPSMIIAKTFKGYGLDDIANKNGYHGKPIPQQELAQKLTQLQQKFAKDAQGALDKCIPQRRTPLPSFIQQTVSLSLDQDPHAALFVQGKELATREAFGYALAALGSVNDALFVFDADVKNSTFSDMFEKEYPGRFVQCFIAEQNMIGVATGFQRRGAIPFVATFAAFFSRAFDQIRMGAIGRCALRLVGSHAGVSIGQDGPSQMGLEDIALIRTLPGSIVLYPCDGVATYALTFLMASYDDGISYLRTTRAVTRILYNQNEVFEIGGSKILRSSNNDQVCLIAAGITVYEALAAYEILKNEGVMVSVIDAYSIKPLDTATIKRVALASKMRIISIEDHYVQGGLGEALSQAMINYNIYVKTLAVNHLSCSGSPKDLLRDAEIDSKSIVLAVKSLIEIAS